MENQSLTPKRTNNEPKLPWFIYFLGTFLQFFSTNLASKYAYRLFTTPIRYQTPKREIPMSKNAKTKTLFIPEINKNIVLYHYGKAKNKVLLVHGWSGRGTQLHRIADKLLENGYMTISFDAPAHGKSESKTTLMSEFVACILEIEKQYGKFDAFIGHSLGGMSIFNAINEGASVKKAVSIGAADLISDIIKTFTETLKLKPIIATKVKAILDKKFDGNVDVYSPSIIAKNIKTSSLIIHDNEDKDVPVKIAYTLNKALKNSSLLITDGLGHRRILRDDFVIEKIITFIKE